MKKNRKSVAAKTLRLDPSRPKLERLPIDPVSERYKAHARMGAGRSREVRARKQRERKQHGQA
jgi:hypothetical protein